MISASNIFTFMVGLIIIYFILFIILRLFFKKKAKYITICAIIALGAISLLRDPYMFADYYPTPQAAIGSENTITIMETPHVAALIRIEPRYNARLLKTEQGWEYQHPSKVQANTVHFIGFNAEIEEIKNRFYNERMILVKFEQVKSEAQMFDVKDNLNSEFKRVSIRKGLFGDYTICYYTYAELYIQEYYVIYEGKKYYFFGND